VRRRWISWVIALCLALSCALGPTPRSARAVGVASINSGGPAIGSFVADTGYSGGSAYSATKPVTTTGATNPAPMAVYQSERFGKTFSYIFSGLAIATPYMLRLHFAEIYWGAVGGAPGGAGSRVFNVAVNGRRYSPTSTSTPRRAAPTSPWSATSTSPPRRPGR